MKPGIYDIHESKYHSEEEMPEPCLSSSITKLLINDSPLHAWTAHPRLNPRWAPDDSKERDFGTIVHALLLEGESRAHVIQALDKNGEIVSDYKTKAAKEERDAARAERKVPILECDMARVGPMLAAAKRQLAIHKDARNAFTAGKPEQTVIWREANGVLCKSRLDWLHDDHRYIDDLKTRNATANPESLSRTLFNEGWDLQAAFYRRGLQAIDPNCTPQFRFVCLETYEPFALSVLSLDSGAMAMAERKVLRAIETFGDCMKSGVWPGYPDRTCFAEYPAWMERSEMEKELREVL